MVRNRLLSFATLIIGVTGMIFLFGSLGANADKNIADDIFSKEVGSSYETISSEKIDEYEQENLLEQTLINGVIDRHTLVNAPAQAAASGSTTVQLEVEAAEYTVTFAVNNAGYGSVSQTSIDTLWGTTYTVSGNTITFSDDQTVTAAPTVANEEWTYTFTNWSVSSGTVTSDLIITANFNRYETPASTEIYTITFESDDDTVANMPDPIEVEDDDGNFTITIPDQTPEKEGYDFEGWTDEEDDHEAKYQPGDEIEINSEDTEIQLYPVWEIKEEEDDEEEDDDDEDDEADEDDDSEEDNQNTENDEGEDNNNAGGANEDDNGPSIHIPDTGIFTGINGIIIASSSLITAIVILVIALSYKVSQQRKFGHMKNICANSGISIRSKDRIGQFKLSKFNKNTVAYYGISAILFVFAGFAVVKTIEGNKSQALTVDNPTLSITVPNQIELTAEQGEFAAGSINLTVSGNNPTGHTITTSITGANEALVNEEDDDLQIPSVTSVTSATSLQNSTSSKWGITDDLDDGYTTVSSLGNIVFENTNRASQYESQTPIYVGVKTTTSTIPGTYSSEPITFAATTNVAYVDYTLVYELNGGTGTFPNQTDTVPTYESNPTATYTITTNVPTNGDKIFLGWDTDGTKNSNPTYVYDSTTGTITPSTITTTSSTQSLYAIWANAPTAKAILGSNGNLNFVYDGNIYTVNEAYTDNLGETTITAIYDVPANAQSSSQVPWAGYYSYDDSPDNDYRQDITTVNFASSFHSYEPNSTAYWFYYDEYISSVTNAQNLNTSNIATMHAMFFRAGHEATTWNTGDLGEWDMSNVTDIRDMFASSGYNATTWYIGDLSGWNTSNATNMSSVFNHAGYNAITWNIGNLAEWNTSSVTDMRWMFYGAGYNATTWNIGNLDEWDTNNVTNMIFMFDEAGYTATTWNIGNLDEWDTSNVTNMVNMFDHAGYSASTWNIGELNEWDTHNVTNMFYMFSCAGCNATTWNIGELSEWDTSKVTNTSHMFAWAGYNATAWDIGNLSEWDTSSVINMSYMFANSGYSATTWNIGDLSEWDTSSVINMSYMFYSADYSATTWNIGSLSEWDISSVTKMGGMFRDAGYNAAIWTLDMSNWNTSSVTDMNYMFAGAGYRAATWNIGDVSGWDTSNVTDMSNMFSDAGYNANIWTLDLSGWDTSSVTNMTTMFHNARKLQTIYVGDGWNTDNVISSEVMFEGATSLIGGNGTVYDANNVDKTYARVDGRDGLPGYLTHVNDRVPKAILGANGNLNFVYDARTYTVGATYTDNLGETTISAVYNVPTDGTRPDWAVQGQDASTRSDITSVNFTGSFYSFKPTTTKYWFMNDGHVSSITNAQNLNVSLVEDMTSMFNKTGYNATAFNIEGLDNWDTSNLTNAYNLFFSTGYSASTWSIGDLSGWDTSSLVDATGIFHNAGYSATAWSIGDLSEWDTSNVEDMNYMFSGTGFRASTWSVGDLSNWDTSKVEFFSDMFSYSGGNASVWDIGDISGWDTSSLLNTSNMFDYAAIRATEWDLGDLGNWDTSNVVHMDWMFNNAAPNATHWYIGDLSSWDTGNVQNMAEMFQGAGKGTTTWNIGDLSNWDTKNVTNMASMFSGAASASETWNIGNLDNWNTSNVKDMSYMFSHVANNAMTWNIGNLSNWDTSKVEDMAGMFSHAGYSATNWSIGDLSSWNVSKVTDVSFMFSHTGNSATTWSVGDLSNWDVSKVTNMWGLFSAAGESATSWDVGNLDNWNTSNVTNMAGIFSVTGKNATYWNAGDISGWDTSKVTKMSATFSGIPVETLDLRGWNMRRVEDVGSMFINCRNLKTIIVGDDWVLNYQTSSNNMFLNDVSLVGENGTTYDANYTDKTYAHVDGEGGRGYLTYYIESTPKAILGSNGNLNFVYDREIYTVGNTYTDNIGETTITSVYYVPTDIQNQYDIGWSGCPYLTYYTGCTDKEEITSANFSASFSAFKPTSTAYWFHGDQWLSNITNTQYLDTSNVTDMHRMFYSAGVNAAAWDIDLSNWDTSNVTDMSDMFNFAGYNATTWTVDVSNWNTSNVTNMAGMFSDAGGKASTWTLDVSNWDTGNVVDMGALFSDTGKNTTAWTVDVSNWDMRNVTNISWMFCRAGYNASTWTVDVSNWNTSNVTDAASMFYGAGHNATTWDVDVSNWDTRNIIDMSQMFRDAGYNAAKWNLDISGWNTSNVTNMQQMFYNAGNLQTIYVGDDWNVDNVISSDLMFAGATSLIGGNGTTYDANHTDKTYARVDTAETPGYFTYRASNTLNSANSYAAPQGEYVRTNGSNPTISIVLCISGIIIASGVFAYSFSKIIKQDK